MTSSSARHRFWKTLSPKPRMAMRMGSNYHVGHISLALNRIISTHSESQSPVKWVHLLLMLKGDQSSSSEVSCDSVFPISLCWQIQLSCESLWHRPPQGGIPPLWHMLFVDFFPPRFTLKAFIFFIFWSMGHTSGWSNSVEICCHFQSLSSTACPIPALRGQTGSTFKVWFVKCGPITHYLCRWKMQTTFFFPPESPGSAGGRHKNCKLSRWEWTAGLQHSPLLIRNTC